MKAKELAKLLLENPEAEVVFDDGCTEYIYSVDVLDLDNNSPSFSLTWDTSKCWIQHEDGELIEP